MAKNIIIVGGGMSGLVTARLLAEDKNNKITIIERSDEFGGLYTSTKSKLGYVFDHGSHTVLDTGVDELDAILFEDFKEGEWEVINDSLKETVYFMGEHTANSVCPDARKLPPETYAQGLAEFMALAPSEISPKNLEEKLHTTYGKTFTEHLIRPIIEKFYNGDFKDLSPMMYKDFLPLSRLIMFNEQMTEQLKSIPYFDDNIAWTNFKNGTSLIKKYFSIAGGVGVWPALIEAKVREMGVNMLPGRMVSSVNHAGKIINSVVLENGEVLECDQLVWTIPAIMLFQAAGIIPPKSVRPKVLQSVVYNFVFDKPLLKDDHWVFNYDKDMDTFRVTLYPNLTTGKPGPAPHHITVEVLKDPQDLPNDINDLWDSLFDEQVKMGFISADTKVIDKYCYAAPGARPIPTIEFKEAQEAQISVAKESFLNLKLYGRGNGVHFMNPLLREIWFDIKDMNVNPHVRPTREKAA